MGDPRGGSEGRLLPGHPGFPRAPQSLSAAILALNAAFTWRRGGSCKAQMPGPGVGKTDRTGWAGEGLEDTGRRPSSGACPSRSSSASAWHPCPEGLSGSPCPTPPKTEAV